MNCGYCAIDFYFGYLKNVYFDRVHVVLRSVVFKKNISRPNNNNYSSHILATIIVDQPNFSCNL